MGLGGLGWGGVGWVRVGVGLLLIIFFSASRKCPSRVQLQRGARARDGLLFMAESSSPMSPEERRAHATPTTTVANGGPARRVEAVRGHPGGLHHPQEVP